MFVLIRMFMNMYDEVYLWICMDGDVHEYDKTIFMNMYD